MATETKSNAVRSKPSSNQAGPSSSISSSKAKVDPSVTKKKAVETSSSRLSAGAKQKSVSKSEVKVKQTSSSSKTVPKTREKKVFSLPGQKFDFPEEREPLRIFYESLSRQIPSSEMAEFWLMEHGLLTPDRAKKAFEKKQRKQKQLRSGIPIKSPQPMSSCKPESSTRLQLGSKNGQVKEKKRIKDDSDDEEDDFVLSHKRRKG